MSVMPGNTMNVNTNIKYEYDVAASPKWLTQSQLSSGVKHGVVMCYKSKDSTYNVWLLKNIKKKICWLI